ncbi:probable chitinase 2 [Anabrus simplex]|uniref:probable chitinase 2 n=1 Tax=Anabrus simplex TaxID=316456 RepID=UPI0035A35498
MLSTLLVILAVAHLGAPAKHIVCYYGSWATYRAWPGKFDPSDIDASKCTHLVYAFAGLDAASLSVTSLDSYNDLDENYGKGSYKKFTALAQSHPNVKTLLAVGGWNEGSAKYSSMAATSAGRKRFAQSAVAFLQKYGFQGLDFDWEYPTQREGRPEDRANFVLLLKELYSQMKSNNLLLTVALAGSESIINAAYNVSEIASNVDFMNVMTFDYLTASSSVTTGQAAPLESAPGLDVVDTIKQYLERGAPKEKLVVGIPFYARTFTLSTENNGEGAPAQGPGRAGPISQEAGYLTYYELCMQQEDENWTIVKTEAGDVYSYNGNQWASYDDVDVIAKKVKYILDNDLGGVMIWPLEADDNSAVCKTGKAPLLDAVYKSIGN